MKCTLFLPQLEIYMLSNHYGPVEDYLIHHDISLYCPLRFCHLFIPLRTPSFGTLITTMFTNWLLSQHNIVGTSVPWQWVRWRLKSPSLWLFTVYSGADQRKHQIAASLAFVRGICRWPVNSPHKGLVTRKMFPFNDAIMSTAAEYISHRLLTACHIDVSLKLSISYLVRSLKPEQNGPHFPDDSFEYWVLGLDMIVILVRISL